MAAPYRCRGGAPLGRARGRGGRGLGAAARLARQPRRLLEVARRRRGRLAAVKLGAARARGRGRVVRGGRGLAARALLAGQVARLCVRRRSVRLQLLRSSAATALTNRKSCRSWPIQIFLLQCRTAACRGRRRSRAAGEQGRGDRDRAAAAAAPCFVTAPLLTDLCHLMELAV